MWSPDPVFLSEEGLPLQRLKRCVKINAYEVYSVKINSINNDNFLFQKLGEILINFMYHILVYSDIWKNGNLEMI